MSDNELEAYRLIYGRDPPELREAAQAASVAAARAGVEVDEETPDVVEPLDTAQVTSETLKETLLGAVALAHARVISGKFGTAPGEQAGFDKVLAMVRDFPDLAKALEAMAAYERPEQEAVLAAAEAKSAPKTVSETVRRLRAMGYGK